MLRVMVIMLTCSVRLPATTRFAMDMDMELLFRDEDHAVDSLLFGLADAEVLDLGLDFAMDKQPEASSPSTSSSPASSYSSPSAASDDMSGDWLTDAASEVTSPPSQRFSSPMKSPLSPVPLAAMTLPYALPVAFFPPQPMPSMTQKRTFPEMAATTTALPSAVPAPNGAKRSKREIRQMKNRESANKSRLRRKAQLGELTTEVQELTKAKHELENTIAGLRAENKSLREQNSFLRSLVTGDQTARQAALLQQQHQSPATVTSISVLESPQQTDEEEQEEEESTVSPKTARRSTQTSRVLAAVACASVFGITVFSDYEAASGSQHHIRRSGRVLHGLPSPLDNGLTPVTDPNGPLLSMVFMLWAVLVSLWTECISTKWTRDMLVGFVVNVVSYEIIASVHHLWWKPYQRSKSSKKKKLPTGRSSRPHRSSSICEADTVGSRRTTSWDALRFRDLSRNAAFDQVSSLPRVHVLT